jgi:3-oxoadipate enol-lactonase
MTTATVVRSEIKGQGSDLVLLHAFPLDHHLWDGLKLPGYRLILPDYPGFGLSAGSSCQSIEDASDALRDHLRSLTKDPVVLGGISMGGYWALEFLHRYPDIVSSLILISTRCDQDPADRLQKRTETVKRLEKEGSAWYAESMVQTLLGPTTRKLNPFLADRTAQKINQANCEAIIEAQMAMIARRDHTQTLKEYRRPCLWMAGDEDPTLSIDEAQKMASLASQGAFKCFPKCGHLIPLESHHAFTAALREFLP